MVAHLPPCLIGMEACSGAHHWAREFSRFGHTVKLMAPKFVAPYRMSGKRPTVVNQPPYPALPRLRMNCPGGTPKARLNMAEKAAWLA